MEAFWSKWEIHVNSVSGIYHFYQTNLPHFSFLYTLNHLIKPSHYGKFSYKFSSSKLALCLCQEVIFLGCLTDNSHQHFWNGKKKSISKTVSPYWFFLSETERNPEEKAVWPSMVRLKSQNWSFFLIEAGIDDEIIHVRQVQGGA